MSPFLPRLIMTAAAPSLSSSTSPSRFVRGARIAARPSSPPSILAVRSPPSPRSPRFSAAYTSPAAEKERTSSSSSSSYYYYSHSSSSSSSSLYEVLGLTAGATCQEIKAAYRRLARACHPDVVADDCKGTSADQFMQIHAAYATLSDPDKRADYDGKLLAGRRRTSRPYASPTVSYPSASASASAPFFSGFTRRTWETDQCW